MKKNMTWNRLWVRNGWNLETLIGRNWIEGIHYRAHNETDENMKFLTACLSKADIQFDYDEGLRILTLESAPPEEEHWLPIVSAKYRGRTENVGIYGNGRQLNVYQLDTFISGVVRQVNRLGIQTEYSCDGQGKRYPSLVMPKGLANQFMELLQAIGIRSKMGREDAQRDTVYILVPREELLDVAERLSTIDQAWLASSDSIEECLFQAELEQLLSVPGKSGNENAIRQQVAEKLDPFVDTLYTDSYGNLLAEKTYGSGKGPVILLNAHLDIVHELIAGREIIKNNSVWSSSEGILGADDRAGIAILLQVASYLQTSRFRGTVKYILTVEEEIGLVGASHVDPAFLQTVDAAFVLDRRGSGDIVTSCGGFAYFCTDSFGSAIEEIALISDAGEWKCTPGGSSDTWIWAAAGIQSVNLSVGYSNEHTKYESLHVGDCYNTVTLLKSVFENTNRFMPSVREFKRYNMSRNKMLL